VGRRLVKYDDYYGIDTRDGDVQSHGWSGSGVHVIDDEMVNVVLGTNTKYGEVSRHYVTVDLKAYGIKVTAGEGARVEVDALRKPASPECKVNRDRERYGHIDWHGLCMRWLAKWVSADPSRLLVLIGAARDVGMKVGVDEKRQEWADWFRDGMQKAGISNDWSDR